MVRLCLAGGSLSPELKERLEAAAQAHEKEGPEAALVLYCTILNDYPQQPQTLFNLGNIAYVTGDANGALQFFQAACQSQPDYTEAWYNSSVILRLLGRTDEALIAAKKTTTLASAYAPAWDMTAQIMTDKGDYAEALKCYARAIGLQPQNAQFHANYAHLLMASGDINGAYRAAKLATALDPNHPPILFGNILKAMGYPALAADAFTRAHTLLPDFNEAATSAAMARLQIGDYATGWGLWEKRSDFTPELSHIPTWRGETTDHLLLYEDQGLGDAIQFLRYIPLIESRAQNITLRIRHPLAKLCATNFPHITVIEETAPIPAAQTRCRLSSLPGLFQTGLKTIPSAPYLKTQTSTKWQNQLATRLAPRIGIVWAGNPQFHGDRTRSLPTETITPFLEKFAAHLVSLQKDITCPTSTFYDATPDLIDFQATAELINQLDLVIAVDTAAAHLAGALGKPVWILLPFDNDWRWLVGREDSPWYPTARLFRQKEPHNWTGVLAHLSSELNKLIAGDTTVLTAIPYTGAPLTQNPDALPLPT